MKNQHWQDWVTLLLGLWVIVSPWTIKHVMAGPGNPSGVPVAAMWDHNLVGVLVVVFAALALTGIEVWEEWVNVVLGAWLAISPWLFGFGGAAGLAWNGLLTGALIIVFSGWMLFELRGRMPAK